MTQIDRCVRKNGSDFPACAEVVSFLCTGTVRGMYWTKGGRACGTAVREERRRRGR